MKHVENLWLENLIVLVYWEIFIFNVDAKMKNFIGTNNVRDYKENNLNINLYKNWGNQSLHQHIYFIIFLKRLENSWRKYILGGAKNLYMEKVGG